MPFDDLGAGRRFMPVWSFIFCDPADPVRSCRVAAPTKGAAILFLETALNRQPVTQPPRDPAKRVIVQNMGIVARPSDFVAELIEIVERSREVA